MTPQQIAQGIVQRNVGHNSRHVSSKLEAEIAAALEAYEMPVIRCSGCKGTVIYQVAGGEFHVIHHCGLYKFNDQAAGMESAAQIADELADNEGSKTAEDSQRWVGRAIREKAAELKGERNGG